MATADSYVKFEWDNAAPFTFTVILDGIEYAAKVTWNIFGLRYYLNLYSSQGEMILSRSIVPSPDNYDISIVGNMFTSALVFRNSSQNFEVWPSLQVHPQLTHVA
jgi:hypothetical protein